ncbi:MATE family efflux transporter [Parachlamydia acanthamoebae]|jgi:MATE family multidrug resistance protein|nr:MATE family efflux transporter [Parachlamydia acanthamoebae]
MTHQHIVYSSGNIKEVWKTSLPLMFSWLSVVLMTFVDRLYLAHYSTDALNSTVTSGTIAMAFTYGLQTLCEMGGVLVAQYNGAQRYDQIGKVIWQVLWITLGSFVFFIPLSFFGGDILFGNSSQGALEKEYFSKLVLFGPALGLIGSISGFYIGRGFTAVITKVVIVGNISNIFLDPLFIFGWGDFQGMGVKGAALATGISWIAQGLILLGCFLRASNQKIFNAFAWRIDFKLLWDCIKIGLPTTLFIVLEIGGWGVFYIMMRDASPTHILVAGICQSILILFVFVGCGVQKGIASIAGNLIGAKKTEHLNQLMRSGVCIISGYFLFTCIPLILFPDFIISCFLHNPESLEGASQLADLESLRPLLRFGLVCTCIYLYLEDLRMVFSGILSGAGDTFFLMVSGVIAVWLFLLLPSYVGIVQNHVSVEMAMGIWVFYSFTALLIPLYRFYYGNWRERKVIEAA